VKTHQPKGCKNDGQVHDKPRNRFAQLDVWESNIDETPHFVGYVERIWESMCVRIARQWCEVMRTMRLVKKRGWTRRRDATGTIRSDIGLTNRDTRNSGLSGCIEVNLLLF